MMSTLLLFGMLQSLMHVIGSALLELHRPHAQSRPGECLEALLGLLIFHYLTGPSPRDSEALSPVEDAYRSKNVLPWPTYLIMISLRSASG